jgi:hypothetical protein
MRRTLLWSVLALAGFILGTSPSSADVIVTGPLGRQVVVSSPADVRVGPGVYVAPARSVMVAQPLPPVKAGNGNIVSVPMAVVRPQLEGEPIPPPKGLGVMPVQPPPVVAILPRDFAKHFKPAQGNYEVTFLHPVTKCPVTVCFTLPCGPGCVYCCCNCLVFDYGRHEVEIRFKIGGKVVVTSR